VSVKKNADTQNRKNGNLRVGEKEGGHAKQEKKKFACRGKRRRTRKTGKMDICVSGEKKVDTQNEKKGNLRVYDGKALHEMRFAQAAPWQQGILPQAGPSLLHSRDGIWVGRPLSRGGREADGALVTQPRLSQSDF